jgi:hypothetical protein
MRRVYNRFKETYKSSTIFSICETTSQNEYYFVEQKVVQIKIPWLQHAFRMKAIYNHQNPENSILFYQCMAWEWLMFLVEWLNLSILQNCLMILFEWLIICQLNYRAFLSTPGVHLLSSFCGSYTIKIYAQTHKRPLYWETECLTMHEFYIE